MHTHVHDELVQCALMNVLGHTANPRTTIICFSIGIPCIRAWKESDRDNLFGPLALDSKSHLTNVYRMRCTLDFLSEIQITGSRCPTWSTTLADPFGSKHLFLISNLESSISRYLFFLRQNSNPIILHRDSQIPNQNSG
jgi:hypothetical protein